MKVITKRMIIYPLTDEQMQLSTEEKVIVGDLSFRGIHDGIVENKLG